MSNHGGKRKGAGRPPVPAADRMELLTLRVPKWLLDRIDGQDGSRAEVVRRDLMSKYPRKQKS